MDFGVNDSIGEDQTVGGDESVATRVNPYSQPPASDVPVSGGAPITAGGRPSAPFTYDPNSPGPVSSDGVPLLPLLRRLESSADDAVSPAGAIGRYQIVPRFWPQFDPQKLKDPAYNTAAATYIAGKLSDQYGGDPDLVAIAYNGGPKSVQKYLDAGRDPSVLPHETQAYLAHAHELMGTAQPAASPTAPAFGAGDSTPEPAFGAHDSAPTPAFGMADSAPPAQDNGFVRAGKAAVGGAIGGAGELVSDLAQTNKDAIGALQKVTGMSPVQLALAVPILAPSIIEAQPEVAGALKKGGAAISAADIAPANRSPLESFLHGAGQTVPVLAASAANPAVGAGLFGSQGYADAYNEAIKAGKSPAVAALAGVENAAAQAGLSMVPFEKIVGPLLRPAAKVAAKVVGHTVADVGVHSAADAAMMGSMQGASNVVAEQNYAPDRPLGAGVGQAALMGAAGGAVVHAGRAAFNAATGRLRPAETPPGPNGEATTPPMPATDAIEKYISEGTKTPAEGTETPVNVPANVPTQPSTPEGETAPLAAENVPAHVSTVNPQVAAIAADVPAPVLTAAAADVDEVRNAAPKDYGIFQAIKSLGGMRVKEADGSATAGPDVQGALTDARKPPGMINNKSGMSPEQMQEALADRGWLDPNDPEAFINALRQEAGGTKFFHSESETAQHQVRRAVLDHEMAAADVQPSDAPAVAAAKLAAWRDAEVETGAQMEALRERADALGVPHDRATTYSDLLGDVIEREAIQGETTHAGFDAHEREIHGGLTEADLERLDALAAEGLAPEHGASPAAFPLPEGWESEPGVPEAYSEPFEGPGGGGEGPARAAGEAAALEPAPKTSRTANADAITAELAAASEAHGQAYQAFEPIRRAYQKREIGDDEYMVGRRLYDAALARYDMADKAFRDLPKAEKVRLANETAEQAVIPGAERSARQASAAREGPLRPTVPQREAGGLFAEPEPQSGLLFGADDSEPKFARTAAAGALRLHHAIIKTDVGETTAKDRALMAQVQKALDRIVPFAETHAYRSITEGGTGEPSAVLGMAYRDRLRHIIAYALDHAEGARPARHEAVHALRMAGVIHPEEWEALAHTAVSEGWISRYRIPERYGDLTPAEQIEEAVAEHFSSWTRQGLGAAPGFVGEAFARIKTFLALVADAARRVLGKDVTANDVLSRMESGEIGARPPGAARLGDVRFARKPIDEETKGTPGLINGMLGRGADAVGRKLAAAADRVLPDPASELLDEIKMGVSPMGMGTPRAQATAKDFANALRQSAYQWGKLDEWLVKTFKPEERRAMWEAADEHGVILRRGQESGPKEGLNRLTPAQRGAVEAMQARAATTFAHAQDLGMVRGEGLESYVPRMVVEMTAGGPKVVSRATPKQTRRGANLSTTTGQLRQRKYETVEETEAAAKAAFGPGANVVRDIRTLGLATQRLEQAVAGRTLVDKIKAMSKDAGGGPLVSEGANPDPGAYFTIDGHPALSQWGPKMVQDHETGKFTPALDQNGETVFESHPLWISREFEGPLKAVLTSPSMGVTRALMDLKAKMMSVIMYSPLMHGAVIWGKALPVDPIGMLTLRPYLEGNAARKDSKLMVEAIGAGLDPIGHRYFNQDITGIAAAEGQDMTPGRSWTSQVLAYVPGLFDPAAGEAVKRAVDRFGDVWHNTFLWDRVADLQAGIYIRLRDGLVAKGVDPLSAQRTAAHFANRYAGALPMEGMSKLARSTANLMLFSRSFTLGNLAAYKDMVAGLPSDVRAQIARDGGTAALERVQGAARTKAIGMLALDVAFQYAGLSLAAAATAWLTHEAVQWPWQNEAGKENRFLIGYQPDGTAIYGRLPTGKVAEDLTSWATDPRDTLLRKLSPYGRLMYEVAANDKGFGQKLYDPYDHTPLGLAKNVGRVTWAFMSGIGPIGQIEGAQALMGDHTGQDKKTAELQAIAPFGGLTISKGAPGGPAMADIYQARDAQQFKFSEARASIVQQIKSGDLAGARRRMTQLGVPAGLQGYEIRVALNPRTRMSARAVRDFLLSATPQQRARLEADRTADQARAAAQ